VIDTKIRPFRVDVPQADIDDLRERLARTRWPDELPGAAWGYGIPLGYMKELAEYWRTGFDWRKHEAQLNKFPQFTTTIDGQNVHFLHVRSSEPHALPLLMTHGWPGSVVEFLEVIQPLTDPRGHGGDPKDAFDVVAPSIPGFGFSGPTRETGWDVKRIARAFAELMNRLGYSRFGAQGGDWGSAISRQLGLLDPDHVIGLHLNTLATPPSGDPAEMALLTDAEKGYLDAAARFRVSGTGYFMQQSSKPQTLAYGLTDSPAGQLAWIAEKFKEWTDSSDVIEDAVSRDRLLTNVSVYWFTGTANSSARLYYELRRRRRRLESPSFRARSRLRSAASRKSRTTSRIGRSSIAAGISRRWSSRICSLGTCANSSAPSARRARLPVSMCPSAPYTPRPADPGCRCHLRQD
jgi:microsomal epoxide hydrolase